MKALIGYLLGGLLFGPALVAAKVDIRQEQIQFAQGTSDATVRGKISGYEIVDYRLRARAGQALAVSFEPTNRSAYFNVLPPEADEALFVGSISGNRFEAKLPADGEYTLRVYLMRNAARRNETAEYQLAVGLVGEGTAAAAAAAPTPGTPFDRTLELQGIQFRVMSANSGSVNRLQIVPAGLESDNSPIERAIDGTVTGAEAADLNGDGSPELYVYVTSAGSGSYGSLLAYAANQRKSLSEIYLPSLTQDKTAAAGYLGHDEFAVVERALVRRFPLYRDVDTNAQPTGGMRQLQYQLVPGEAGWQLKVDRVVEY